MGGIPQHFCHPSGTRGVQGQSSGTLEPLGTPALGDSRSLPAGSTTGRGEEGKSSLQPETREGNSACGLGQHKGAASSTPSWILHQSTTEAPSLQAASFEDQEEEPIPFTQVSAPACRETVSSLDCDWDLVTKPVRGKQDQYFPWHCSPLQPWCGAK